MNWKQYSNKATRALKKLGFAYSFDYTAVQFGPFFVKCHRAEIPPERAAIAFAIELDPTLREVFTS